MSQICKNCGGWEGLHRYDTMQCPMGGVEAPIGQKQVWLDTKFEVSNPLHEAAPDLLAACKLAERYHQGQKSEVGKALRAAITKAERGL